MSRITDYILEPKVVYTEGGFLVRVKVIDDYKYKKYIVSENLHYKTVQGSSFTLTDADTTKQAEITEIRGNTTQEGTPTPTSSVEVKTVGGDNEVVVCGKNLFNKSTVTNGYYLNESGGLTSNNNYCVSAFIPIDSGETYYIPTRGTSRTKFYTSNKTAYSNTWDVTDGSKSFTVPSGVSFIRISIAIAGGTAVSLDTFQFEKRNTSNNL